MTIHVNPDGTVELVGACPVDDAELLLQQLVAQPDAVVDWRACEAAHTAVVQVLLVAGVIPHGAPLDPFLRDHVAPLMGDYK